MYDLFRNSLLSLMIYLCLGCASRSAADAPCPTIEMSVGGAPKIELPISDIIGATASRTGGEDQWAIEFTVTDATAARVHEFTSQHIGSNLAIAVDGKVRGTPVILGAVAGKRQRIEGLSRAEAERLTSAISHGCRR